MKAFTFTAIVTGAVGAALLGFAGTAAAAPTGPAEVTETIRTLEASGYNVIVNRTGAAPLSQCTVDSVRQGQRHVTTEAGSDLEQRVVSNTVYVNVRC